MIFFNADIDTIPCWSVGRLIDIARVCLEGKKFRVFTALMIWEDQIEQAIRLYTAFEKEFDFSKLDEDCYE